MTELAEDEAPTTTAVSRHRPTPLDSLQAASRRLTSVNYERFSKTAPGQDWQAEAQQMFRVVGELRFLTILLANQVGRVKFYVGRLSDDPLADPEPIPSADEEIPEGADPPSADDTTARDAWESFGGTIPHRTQMITRCAINLFAPGDGWFVGVPPDIEDELHRAPGAPDPRVQDGLISGPRPLLDPDAADTLDLSTLTWRFLSTAEVTFDRAGTEVELAISDSETGKWKGNPDRILAFRCWRPDPFQYWLSDSPTRASLPVLRKIVGLGDAQDAQLDSRLTGAGVFLVPQTADDAVRSALGPTGGGDQVISPFMAAMMDAFAASIKDRNSAARTTPITFTVPDDTVEKFRHIAFASPLDKEYQGLEDSAIGRLALGLDAPKELLTGVGSMNHWGAWLVQEDTVGAHIAPPAAIMADAFTTQFLWPILESTGMDADVAHKYVVWYSVDHLIVRPNRFADAKEAHAAGALSDSALRQYGGFDDDDAPDGRVDQALTLALELLRGAPSLAADPGLPALVEQIRASLAGDDPEPANDAQAAAAEAPDGVPPADGGPPSTESDQPAMAASGTTRVTGLVPGADGTLVQWSGDVPTELVRDPQEAFSVDR